MLFKKTPATTRTLAVTQNRGKTRGPPSFGSIPGAQRAGASPASSAGRGGRDALAPLGDGRGAGFSAAAQTQVLAASGDVASARASSIIRRIVRAQRPHSALHPRHR